MEQHVASLQYIGQLSPDLDEHVGIAREAQEGLWTRIEGLLGGERDSCRAHIPTHKACELNHDQPEAVDRSSGELSVDDQQQLFCARLKAAREQKGISLECIAASTKISVSVYEGLERNNLSGWPKGLYRRAYLRSYLTALGLPPEPIVQEFRELFPVEEDDAFLRAASPPTTDALATAAPERKSAGLAMPSWLRLLAGVFDMTKAAAAIAAVGRRFVKDTDGHARGTVVRIRIVR